MLECLRSEGWDLKERELNKLRKEQNLLLREPNRNGNGKRAGVKRKRTQEPDEINEQIEQQDEDPGAVDAAARSLTTSNLAPEIRAKRQARQARLLAESEERLKAGTRRRRTKVWSGLPPDPVAPPRYPSELTMEECKRELGLDKQLYQELRDIFEGICRANNVVKKTSCGIDTWKGIKEELISRMSHLQSIFWGHGSATINQTQRPMALELICMDVTKKIRTVGTRVTISEAKNILGLTPQEARDARMAFDEILKEDHFVSKLEVPREHWDGLKAQWVERSSLLQRKLSGSIDDLDHATKLKCLESIAADVQKRHRDQQTKSDPAHLTKSLDQTRNPHISEAPHAVPSGAAVHSPTNSAVAPFSANAPTVSPATNMNNEYSSGNGAGAESAHLYRHSPFPAVSVPQDGMTTLASQALASAAHPSFIDYGDMQGLQIDPSLLEAAALPQGSVHYDKSPHEFSTQDAIPVYFRLSPLSSLEHIASHPKVWLSTLSPPYSMGFLRELALSKAGSRQASATKIEGVAPGNGDEGGTKWSIDEDDELEAYLEMVGRGKATFIVEIA